MIRLTLGALALLITSSGPQDSTRIAALIQKLDSEDWVEQAQAAKDLAKIGRPAMDPLGKVMSGQSPSAKYWAAMIAESVMRAPSSTPAATPPAPAPAPDPTPVANPRGFAPGENDMGSLVFICNNSSHGGYEVVFSACRVCGKMKRFAYDYGAECYRCAVCKKAYQKSDLKCDKCGQPPAPRMGIRMKSHGM